MPAHRGNPPVCKHCSQDAIKQIGLCTYVLPRVVACSGVDNDAHPLAGMNYPAQLPRAAELLVVPSLPSAG